MMEDDFEPARRELCPDGACVGLIGPDGRCKVCGTVGASAVADPRHTGLRPMRDDDDPGSDLDTDRELCPDGSCVGVLGPDGACKVCGARADGTRSAVPGSTEDPSGTQLEVDDDDDRELCPDGSCLGLIGPDGRCKVCGTARSSSPS
jgi:hypothetical protein